MSDERVRMSLINIILITQRYELCAIFCARDRSGMWRTWNSLRNLAGRRLATQWKTSTA